MSATIFDATINAMPVVVACVALVLFVWALGSALGKGSRPALWVALALSIAVIGWLTIGMTVQSGYTGSRAVSLVPFQEIDRGLTTGAGAAQRNLVGNVVLFMPLGAAIAWLARPGWWRRVFTAMTIGLALSVAIEATQYVLGRVADIDDIMLNTAGALLGAVIAATLGLRSGVSAPVSKPAAHPPEHGRAHY